MSSGVISYNPYYEPVVANRFFSRRRTYDQVYRVRNDLAKMVDAFEDRIRDWYIEPIELLLEKRLGQTLRKIVRWLASRQDGGHYSFAVASMTCLLIDALSQFRYGKLTSDGAIFKQFVKDDLRSYKVTLPNSIWHYEDRHAPKGKELRELADVLWNGFRCGFLHQAHAPLYCGVVPGNSVPSIESNLAKYGPRAGESSAGSDCPVVILQPEHLFDEVMTFLADYLKNLKNKDPQHEGLRANFRKKFSDAFGIDIMTATLKE